MTGINPQRRLRKSSNAYWIDHDSATIDLGGTVYDFLSGTRTFYNFNKDINTTGGILNFTDGISRGTFTATMGVPDTGSTIALLGCALLGFAALRRRLIA